jgi:UDP-glucose:glycoprotein glucosyltransferase
VATAKADSDAPRFDWRDEIEGGNVIIWMNDIEKDKRYSDWPRILQAVSMNGYRPGEFADLS